MPHLHAVESPAPFYFNRQSAKIAGWLILALVIAFFAAASLVIMGRLDTVSTRLLANTSQLHEKTVSEDLARTRYETELQMIRDIKIELDTQKAQYDEDVRSGILIVHERARRP